jgi:polysaccharide biosynthesis/export protein
MTTHDPSARWLALLLPLAWVLASCLTTGKPFDPRAAETAGFREVTPTATLDPALLAPPKEPYLLGSGDILRIELAGLPNSLATTFVTPDGMVYYDLAGGLKAEGLTIPELSKELRTKLTPYYRNPAVSVTLTEVKSKRYWLLGNVAEPGIYPLGQPTTLIDAISSGKGILTSRATGTTIEMADLARSLLIRDGLPLPVNFEALVNRGDMTQNVYIRTGDFIYLPSISNQEVFVLGAVKNPRAVGLSGRMGVIAAMADAGGPIPGAFYQQMLLIRGSLSQPKVAVFNYNDLATGKLPDFPLQPGDVIWVPNSPWQRLEKYLDGVIGTVSRTIAANEGRNAAEGENATRVETSISVGN